MKVKKPVKTWELWYMRLAIVITWILANIAIIGIVFDTHQDSFIAGLSFFLVVLLSQLTFYLMLKLMEKVEVEE